MKKSKKKTGTKVTKELANILDAAITNEGRRIIQEEIDAEIITNIIALYKETSPDK